MKTNKWEFFSNPKSLIPNPQYLCLLLILLMSNLAFSQTSIWNGTADTTWYTDYKTETEFTMTTAEQLAGLALLVNSGTENGTYDMFGKIITLGNDIVLNDTTGWEDWDENTAELNSWTAIGTSYNIPFRGTFNGNGYVVSGVYINTTTDYQGLFGHVNFSTIKNLGIEAFYIKGGSYVGSLVGYYNLDGAVINSYANGSVSGSSYVGGLVGYGGGTVSNSYATGAVSGTDGYVGGLVGYGGTVSNSYYDSQTSGQSGSGNGKTTAEMQSEEFTNILNIRASYLSMNTWVYSEGNYPALSNQTAQALNISGYFESGDGTLENPYIIKNKEQLKDFSLLVSAGIDFFGEYIKLGNDIALNDTTGWQYWESNPPANAWTAIGIYSTGSFRGSFDGDGYVVRGVYINTTSSYQGLFGYVYGGTIKNLEIEAFYIKGGSYVGSLVGYHNDGTVINSKATGTISGSSYVGGLVGYHNDGTVINSKATGTISGSSYVGGLVGCLYSNGGSNSTVSNSYATGAVSGSSCVGGLVGYLYSNGGSNSTVSNSYATGAVSGSNNVGGLVGCNVSGSNSTVSNSYATGTVSGTDRFVGGLVGYNGGTVSNSYATGAVSGTEGVGGLVGYQMGITISGTVSNSYYDSQTSEQSDIGRGDGKTTAEMQSEEFANILNIGASYLSMNTWVYSEGKYPVLSNQIAQALNISDYFESGDGTIETPYIIKTKEQLKDFSFLVSAGIAFSDEYIKLGNDIVLNDTADWKNWVNTPPANTWIAIGTYSTRPFRGSFDGDGYVVSGVYINTTSNYQGLFGYVYYGIIKNLGVEAFYIKGSSSVGGLLGYNENGTISNSYATGTVSGTDRFVGGLVGYNGGTVSNSYATGAVSGTEGVGGLVGNNYGTISNSYYDSQTSEQSDIGRDDGKTTAEMQSEEFANILNIGASYLSMNAWVYSEGKYPVLSNQIAQALNISDYFESGDGTIETPYIIKTKEQLKDFSFLVSAGIAFSDEYIKLGNDIVLNDTADWKNWVNTPPANAWTTIGTFSSKFRGSFDGDGYVASGVYINTDASYQGLFVYVGSNGIVKNLGVEASYIKGGSYVGGLVGYIGYSGTISNSYATGAVSGSRYVGGLAGYLYGTASNSYATGAVSGHDHVGGLVGIGDGTVSNSYATGAVSGTGYGDVGGLVGSNYGTVINSYATGAVSGRYVGGLVGYNSGGSTVSNSYYDSQTSGRSDTGKGEGKTTAEMKQQATFEDWDFTDTWHIIEDVTYPYLLNKQPIEAEDIPDQIYTGSQIKPEPVVYINSGDKPTLIKGTDYSLIYGTNTNLGIGTITITGLGDYSWLNKEISFRICIFLAADAIQPIAAETYIGSAIIPDVVVKNGSVTLAEGTDYYVAFANNTNAGTATVTVTGKGNYSGTATANFTIEKALILTTDIIFDGDSFTYNGQQQPLTATYNGSSDNFTYAYTGITLGGNTYSSSEAPIDAGHYHVQAFYESENEIGETGEVSLTIEPKAIEEEMFSLSSPTFTGNELEPEITAEYNGYPVTFNTGLYSNNINVGIASVSVTGTGNYSGSLTLQFQIQMAIPTEDPDYDINPIDPDYDINPINPQQIAIGQISVQAINSGILLENLPSNTKVELYNLQGKQVYLGNSGYSQILKILIQTKGVYIVKVGSKTFKVVK